MLVEATPTEHLAETFSATRSKTENSCFKKLSSEQEIFKTEFWQD